MAIFRQKEFGKLKAAKEYIKKYPLLPISGTTLGITSANFVMNNRRYKQDKEFRDHQLKVMNAMTDSMNKASDSMNRMSSSMENFDSRIRPVIDRQNRIIAEDRNKRKKSRFSFKRLFGG